MGAQLRIMAMNGVQVRSDRALTNPVSSIVSSALLHHDLTHESLYMVDASGDSFSLDNGEGYFMELGVQLKVKV